MTVTITIELPSSTPITLEVPFGDISRRSIAALSQALNAEGFPNSLENDHNSLEQALGTN